jgi:hypothetical protein
MHRSTNSHVVSRRRLLVEARQQKTMATLAACLA